MPRALLLCLAACSAAAPTSERPVAPAPAPADAAPPDAAPDAGVPAEVMAAPAWVFRYRTAQRAEVWTLRFAGGAALLEVQTAQGPTQGLTRYQGTAAEGASIAVNVSTSTAKLSLDCKPAKRPLGAACNDAKARPVDLLDCYHADFQEPMPFGPAPGVEYVVDEHCNGYRLARE